ncbi:glycoside hydrolase family 88 protein [Lactococcus lactis]|uniref:Unsaturated chondroitin disaccharide hydrolase n=1 Tax=Lactococcus lactis subsp. lactis TaxID=1360 RepID=A0A2N5WFX4_LACLL|nr:glycoside hydrolase family 88 protein [Lactococcus lactis]PLW61130.1 Unsaturated chondroitin disaccharide hydrolase [Lactococcus lactis subsp. lactis]
MNTNKKRLIQLGQNIDQVWLDSQIKKIIIKMESNMERFGYDFPSASATDGKYHIKQNDDWTNGFWTGMLALAYEYTGDSKFLHLIETNMVSFQKRLDEHFVLDHHDIGFLYSLSAGAAYKITRNNIYQATLLQAADVLLNRFQEKGNFIQAWGEYGDPNEYRVIIDSFINLPLLFAATEYSGKTIYKEVALKHFETLLKTVFRDDSSTYHTYYFDVKTGQPLYGSTHQGHSDTSTWARGQAWAILGIPLNESYIHSPVFPEMYPSVVEIFLKNLPEDFIPYWDFDYTDREPSDKDSSAAAIAACGFLEAAQQEVYPESEGLAKGLIYQLGEFYTNAAEDNEGLLQHGVYAFAEGKGIDEPNLWGDYFYFEALVRLANAKWNRYW